MSHSFGRETQDAKGTWTKIKNQESESEKESEKEKEKEKVEEKVKETH